MVAQRRQSTPGNPAAVSMRVEGIESIVQESGTFRLSGTRGDHPTARPEHLLGESSAEQRGREITATLRFVFRAVPVWLDADEDSAAEVGREPLFEAHGTFRITYRLDSDQPASPADLAAFAWVNGNLNAVPYWREYLHNVLVRAGLPAFEVPVFNPMKMATSAATKEESHGDAE
ncbi:MAG: hypothetical protein KIS87_00750 [Phycisphaeraceae bacterium]|nr:hypothetical protein [Phycisphaeraceae bacterium]